MLGANVAPSLIGLSEVATGRLCCDLSGDFSDAPSPVSAQGYQPRYGLRKQTNKTCDISSSSIVLLQFLVTHSGNLNFLWHVYSAISVNTAHRSCLSFLNVPQSSPFAHSETHPSCPFRSHRHGIDLQRTNSRSNFYYIAVNGTIPTVTAPRLT